ncbi:MAG: hypothetical protein JWM16_5232 [Verrucomicrobiales bacterium]|nr:hypothetical protein [Verrucomicrobiales bacterium]
MLEGSERERSRAAERSLIIECTMAIEPSADFDSPKMPQCAGPTIGTYSSRTPAGASWLHTGQQISGTAKRMLGRFRGRRSYGGQGA